MCKIEWYKGFPREEIETIIEQSTDLLRNVEGNSSSVMKGQRNQSSSWLNFIKGTTLSSKGMPLVYVAPHIKEGQSIARLNKEEVE